MSNLDRREFLKIAGLGTCLIPLASTLAKAEALPSSKFTLPKLPYASDALEPVIDRKTMDIHHGKHHQGYVDKLNKALESLPAQKSKSLEAILQNLDEIPEASRTAVRNNAGGHYNHSLFWESMTSPKADRKASGQVGTALSGTFGSFETFQERFQDAGAGVFGSGWVWLVWNKDSKALEVVTTPNQDTPIMKASMRPLLGNDCWEHAYYLNYQNRRADYLKAWWQLVNWDKVEERLKAAR